MGATTFMNIVRLQEGEEDNIETLGRAFDAAVRRAQYNYGHAGYTGTIAEKSNIELRRVEPFPSFEEAALFVDEDTAHNEKWGPAFAVKFYEDEDDLRYIFYGWASE